MFQRKPNLAVYLTSMLFAFFFILNLTLCSETIFAQSAWHTQTNIYQVFVEKVTPDKTLKGVENKLGYLQDLGVKTIWLMPIFESMDEHGYNTTNYYKIASRYGTEQDLKNLVTAAHNKDMRVILDLVINHTGTMHPWFSSPDVSVRKDTWFIWADKDLKWDDPWKDNPSTNRTNATWFKDPFSQYDRNGDGNAHNDDYYYSVFGDGTKVFKDSSGNIVGYGSTMPDLNYNDTNPKNEIVAEVKKIMGYWLKNTGIDGFRCDAVRYLSEFGAGNQADQDRSHEIWKEWRSWLNANYPNAILLAEAPTENYDQMLSYYGNGDEFHSAFHFMFQEVLMTPPNLGFRPNKFMEELYSIQEHLPANTQDVLFLSNHDSFAGDRVASQLGGDTAKIKLAGSLYILLSGNPSLYYGEEIGMSGSGSDAAIRKPLDWNTVRTQSFDDNSILNHYRRLLKLRNEYDALRGGISYFTHAHYSSDNWWDNNPADGSKILAIIREWFGEKILVVHNFGNDNESIHVSLDSTGLSIPDGTPAYSLMGSAPANVVSSSNRNWYDMGTVFPKCSKVLFLGDISKYRNASQHFVTYENALQDGNDIVTIHYREDHPSKTYYLHNWDDNGLISDKVPMTYEGQHNGGHWWSITMNKMPAEFKFCFVDSNNIWDGTNRTYKKQGQHIYTVSGSSNVSLTRP